MNADARFADGYLTDVEGVSVGHWTDRDALTGCTVVIVPPGTVSSAEVRGSAPASRELALLEPTCTVGGVDAVVLSGGSAFGLGSATGVVEFLEAAGRGFPTPHANVPIVAALALYDLGVGDASVRPGAREGRLAAEAATAGPHEVGAVGAGTGCTIDKWLGPDATRPGALVSASARVGGEVVAALVAVNALGSVGVESSIPTASVGGSASGTNTTVGVVATTARLDKVGCNLLARAAHDGLARAVFPAHTGLDGDAFVVCATGRGGDGTVMVDALRSATCTVVERAIRTLASEC